MSTVVITPDRLDAIINRILDRNLSCEVCYPYIIVYQPFNQYPGWQPDEIAELLDIDPSQCSVNPEENILITCN